MFKACYYVSALSVIALTVAGLAACGGGGSDEVVAQVGGSSITKATLDHWIRIEAVLTYEQFPSKPVPRGVVPDPPDYSACIAYLKTHPSKIVESGPKPTAAQLKSQCRQKNHTVLEDALNFLIHTEWVTSGGAEEGLKVTDKEVRQRLEGLKKVYFPKKVEFEKYLATTGQTVSDMLFRSKVQLLELKFQQKTATRAKLISKGLTAQQRQQALLKIVKEFIDKWVPKTDCHAGYVVPDCKQYKGPVAPGTVL